MPKRKHQDPREEIAKLKGQIAHLNQQLKQQRDLHDEWVETMMAMHGAAIESLERIRIGEAHGRAVVESLVETNGGMRR